MSRTLHLTLATVVAAGMLATTPALAQQNQDGAAAPTHDETVPFQLSAGQVGQMQRKLDELGFSPGRVDGIWGPETSAAVSRFQQKRSLQASGKLDDATFRALGLTTTTSPSPVSAAPAAPSKATTVPVPASPTPPVAADGSVTGNTPGIAPGTAPGGNAGAAAASGDTNQAVATTRANAPQPAHGANSFTQDQAQARIAHEGFQNVGDLRKDNTGVWRGEAAKNGQPAHVWLDYKGNVGQD